MRRIFLAQRTQRPQRIFLYLKFQILLFQQYEFLDLSVIVSLPHRDRCGHPAEVDAGWGVGCVPGDGKVTHK